MIEEYSEKYQEDVKNLLVELEKYIIDIDEDHLDCLHPDYREKYIKLDLDLIKAQNGKCFLYIENNQAVGLVMGIITKYDENDYLDYTCPKKGDIIELIVSKKARSKGIGTMLMEEIENYFKSNQCEWIKISVFSYNKNTIEFYQNKGYHNRMIDIIKKI